MRFVLRLLLLVAIVAAAAGGWWLWRNRPPLVEVTPAVAGPAVEAVYATGTVEPIRWAGVAPAQKARLLEVLVDDGDRVTAGQVLARLDATVTQAQVTEAEARAQYALAEAERQDRLAARSAAARSEVERARSEAYALEAAAEAMRRRLDDFVLKAPIDGVVLRRDGEPGEMMDTSDVVFWIGEQRPLRITADVDEEDVPRVRLGQKALLRADAFPDRVLEGRLVAITPKGDPVQKTYRVRIELPEDSQLMIGMTVEANIVVREVADAVLVPTTAVQDGALFVVTEEHVSRRAVEVGVTGPLLTEIRSGLARAELVVVEPPTGLTSGERVRVADPPAAAR